MFELLPAPRETRVFPKSAVFGLRICACFWGILCNLYICVLCVQFLHTGFLGCAVSAHLQIWVVSPDLGVSARAQIWGADLGRRARVSQIPDLGRGAAGERRGGGARAQDLGRSPRSAPAQNPPLAGPYRPLFKCGCAFLPGRSLGGHLGRAAQGNFFRTPGVRFGTFG